MGQLEKYGLYVLCLVIFLILGVTIWGGGDVPPGKSPVPASTYGPGAANGAARTNSLASAGNMPALADLIDASGDTGRGGAPSPSGRGETANTAGGGAKEVAKLEPKLEPKAEPRVEARPAVYKVQEGDTFDAIARTKLGKASLRDELMRLNPSVDPKKLRPGMELQLPSTAAIPALDPKTKAAIEKPIAPAADGSRTYLVQKGDNFERIAKNELGSVKRRDELMALNAGLDPTKLKPGTRIMLPPK